MSAVVGLRVRPETVVGEERVRERHDSSVEPAVTDETDTATHCIVASSVNNRVPFCVCTLATQYDKNEL